MIEQILIAAPPGLGRRRLRAFFDGRPACRCLDRERIVPGGELVVADDRITLRGQDLPLDSSAAVILDPGYMWPLPVLDPTPEQWARHHGRFDDYLRDERESASLWFSLLAIFGDRLPVCFNSQAARANLALRPDALDRAHGAGAAVAPTMTTNDPEAVARFVAEHPARYLLSLPVTGAGPPAWIDGAALSELPLEREPVMLQAAASREATRVVVVGGAVVGCPGPGLADELRGQVRAVTGALDLELAELTFRGAGASMELSDVAQPDLGQLSDDEAIQVMEAIDVRIRDLSGGAA